MLGIVARVRKNEGRADVFICNGVRTSVRLSISVELWGDLLTPLCPLCLRGTSMELSVEDHDSRFA